MTLTLILPAGGVAAQDTPEVKDESGDLSSMVIWGIVNYTRWPQEDGALKVCLLGSSTHAEVIRRSAEVIQFRRTIVVREIPATVEKIKDCNVAYFGDLPAQQLTLLLRALMNLPVLTIGEDSAFCSAGGMFCLLSDREGETMNGEGLFAANLDVISRSGLKVNPRVLRLSQQMRGMGN